MNGNTETLVSVMVAIHCALNIGLVILLIMSGYRIARLERLVRDLDRSGQ